MQATSSHVITAPDMTDNPLVIAQWNDDETGTGLRATDITSKRAHILDRRRKRATRRWVR